MNTNLIALVGRIFGSKKVRSTARQPRLAQLEVESMEERMAPSTAAGLALTLSPATIRGFNPQPEPPGRVAVALDTSVVKGAQVASDTSVVKSNLVGPNSKAVDQVFIAASQKGPSIFMAVEPTDGSAAGAASSPGQIHSALVDYFRVGS